MLTGDKPHAHVPAPRRPQPAEPANNDSRARPIVVTDISSCIRAVNQPFCAVTGYGAGDLVAKPLSTLIALDGIGIPGKDLSQYLDKDDRWRGKATLTCVDGTDSVVEIAMSAVRHAHGAISHVVVSVLANERPPEPEVPTSYRFDTATGLPRWSMLRFNLDRDLREVQRDGGLLAVMLLGLDNLGSVNRTRGHQAGRQLLEMLAKRLRTALQGRGNVSRLSGDTFTISFSRLKEPGTVPRLAESLMRVVKQPFIFAAQEVVLDAHVGVAVCPEHGRDVDTLLRAAEVALGHAKTRGNGSFEFFSEELHQKECRRLAIESGLRRALKRGELELFYQARVDVRSTRICGAEALIRWRHPEWGLVSPSDFIPVAEETGLIVDIGQWVLWAAVRQFDTWRKQRLPIDHLSVNVTGHQLCRADFPQILHTALSHADLGGGTLELEITETFLMDNVHEALASLQRLKSLGVRIAIDDFGTGYSSLAYLKRLPIDLIKIDRSFVKEIPGDADNCAIVSAIVAMARALGLRVVAEGVETVEQVDFLRRLRCDELQGFLFSKPIPALRFAELVRG